MAGNSNKFSKFWRELKRRKTDRVIVAYAASAFAILQLTEILAGALSLPGWTTPFVIIALAIGFPVAAIFSWFFDITPGGIEKTKPYNEKNRHNIEVQLRKWKGTTMISLIVIIALICFNIARSNINAAEIKKTEKSIAVLPFENLTPIEFLPYSSDAITAIITNGLSQIEDFTVTQRLSVLEFKSKRRSLTEIARKLEVFFLVTGEIVNSRDQILVTVNLIKAKKGKPVTIWANKFYFDPEGSIAEINEIPIEIAKRLNLVLTVEEKDRIKKRPTLNTAAFLNYMEGTNYQDDALNGYVYLSMGDSIFRDLSVEKSFDRAIFFYDKAIKADSTFALAYAKRAITRSWGYRAGYFTGKDEKDKCKNDIEHAMQIDGNLTEALVAYGFYNYYFTRDYDKALEYFRRVMVREPKNWQIKFYTALVLRARGEWEQSQILMSEARKRNIKDPLILTNIGASYQILHQYDTAIYYYNRAIRILPGWSSPYQNKIESLFLKNGNTAEAESVMDTASLRTTGGRFVYTRIVIDLYNKRYKEALLKAEAADLSDFGDLGRKYLTFAEIYSCLNNSAFSREYYKSASEYYSNKLINDPENPLLLSLSGISSAGLNDREKARLSGEKAVELEVYDFLEKSDRKRDLARIYTMLGENKKALALLNELITPPSNLSVRLLQIDPVWAPLYKTPEFIKLTGRN